MHSALLDPGRAEELLDDAGRTEKNDDGVRTKDRQTLPLPGYTSPFLSTPPATIEPIAQQLKTIGIQLDITKTDATTYTDMFNNPATPLAPTANIFLDVAALKGYWGLNGTNQFKLTTEVLKPAPRRRRSDDRRHPGTQRGRPCAAGGDDPTGLHTAPG